MNAGELDENSTHDYVFYRDYAISLSCLGISLFLAFRATDYFTPQDVKQKIEKAVDGELTEEGLRQVNAIELAYKHVR